MTAKPASEPDRAVIGDARASTGALHPMHHVVRPVTSDRIAI
ncbi:MULTISPECIES: hypothetical protein [Chelativorans]|jgi:hypothetical protein|nr:MULTISPECIES: hypothetical protein [Chelativorans]